MARTPDTGQPRIHMLRIRASEAERAELEEAARAAGKSLSDYLREAGLLVARSQPTS